MIRKTIDILYPPFSKFTTSGNEQQDHKNTGQLGGPDAFGLRRRRSSLPYSRYARSSLLGSLQNRLGQLSRLFRDGP